MIPQPVVVDGLRIATFVAGSRAHDAPHIVLVHGIGHWSDGAWGRVVPRLDPAWRVLAFDLPGFGESDKPQRAYDAAFFRRILTGVLDLRTTGPVVIAGHSLGGMIAADFAATYPERVAALALFAPAGMLRAPRMVLRVLAGRFARKLFEARPPRRLIEATLRGAVYDAAALDVDTIERAVALCGQRDVRLAFASVYSGALRAMLETSAMHRRFAAYRGPVLLAWGNDDKYTPVAGLRAARAIYPHATVVQFAKTGHAVTLERPAELAAALNGLLTSRPS